MHGFDAGKFSEKPEKRSEKIIKKKQPVGQENIFKITGEYGS
jgi:hypothetical protein